MGQKFKMLLMKTKFTGYIPLSTRIPKIYFFAREAENLEEGQPENLEKRPKTGKSIVMQIREWSILTENTGLYSLASKSLHYFGFPAC